MNKKKMKNINSRRAKKKQEEGNERTRGEKLLSRRVHCCVGNLICAFLFCGLSGACASTLCAYFSVDSRRSQRVVLIYTNTHVHTRSIHCAVTPCVNIVAFPSLRWNKRGFAYAYFILFFLKNYSFEITYPWWNCYDSLNAEAQRAMRALRKDQQVFPATLAF